MRLKEVSAEFCVPFFCSEDCRYFDARVDRATFYAEDKPVHTDCKVRCGNEEICQNAVSTYARILTGADLAEQCEPRKERKAEVVITPCSDEVNPCRDD